MGADPHMEETVVRVPRIVPVEHLFHRRVEGPHSASVCQHEVVKDEVVVNADGQHVAGRADIVEADAHLRLETVLPH